MSEQDLEKIKEQINNNIDKIVKLRGVNREDLISELKEIMGMESLDEYPQEVKLAYASRILTIRYLTKETTKSYTKIIPFGVTGKRKTRAGVWRASIYAIVKDGSSDKPERKEIVCTGAESDIPEKVELFKLYNNIRLEDKFYFLSATPSTRFDNPQDVEGDPLDFLQNVCKFPKLNSLRDVLTNLSTLVDGYVDNMDMRIIEAITVRGSKGLRKDGSYFAVYDIKDESLGLEEEVVKIDGKDVIVPSKISAWVPPRFLKYDTESILTFLGTITLNVETKIPTINAVTVLPSGIVRELKESED